MTAFVGEHQSTDTVATFSPAWQLAHHGNLWMDRLAARSGWLVHANGHWVSARFPGAIFLAAPFYAVLSPESAAPTVGPSLVASVLCAAAAVAVTFLCLDRLLTRRQAIGGALIGAFGTATWNVSAVAWWTHGPAQLALALAVVGLLTGRLTWAGVALGGAVVARPPLLVAAVVVVGLAVMRGRSWRPAVRLLPGLLVAVGLLLAYNAIVFGRVGVDSGYQESGARDIPSGPLHMIGNLPGALFSPARGLLVLSPFLAVLCLGLTAAWREASATARDCALAGVAYLLVELWLLPFTGADGFYAYRLPLETLVLAAPLLAYGYRAFVRDKGRRLVFGASVAVSVAFQAVAAFLRHPPLIVADAWSAFMPARAVSRGPLTASVSAAIAVCCVVAWTGLAGRRRAGSSVRSE